MKAKLEMLEFLMEQKFHFMTSSPYNVSRHNIFSWKYDFQVVSLRTQRKKRVWAFHLDIHWQARVQKTTLASYCTVQTLITMQSPFDFNGTQYRWICGQDLGLPV